MAIVVRLAEGRDNVIILFISDPNKLLSNMQEMENLAHKRFVR